MPIFGPRSTSTQRPDRRRPNLAHILEATAAAVLAAAVLGTASGMGWLVISLPTQLQAMKEQIGQIVKNQETFGRRFDGLEERVMDHDRRLIKLEVRR